eukprot:CAMPEP_0113522566 /NCGR_PEP_ID=MMETSP0014_2-20120614/45257_1 /TAXON_ID=2857 /ORGANISM="Nitzschia sp." /LENGTH=657 /DNA_ID=CAMNT_0000420631 /DNA_START=320 /DNA_END=2293 /DNA_ORIENTATION=- /assembly_acc=CAM_ASM_000159
MTLDMEAPLNADGTIDATLPHSITKLQYLNTLSVAVPLTSTFLPLDFFPSAIRVATMPKLNTIGLNLGTAGQQDGKNNEDDEGNEPATKKLKAASPKSEDELDDKTVEYGPVYPLNNVHALEINHDPHQYDNNQIDSMLQFIVDHFPKMKSLTIRVVSDDDGARRRRPQNLQADDEIPPPQWPSPATKKLKAESPKSEDEVEDKTVEYGPVYPLNNVRTLEINLDPHQYDNNQIDSMLQFIVDHFPKMERLTVGVLSDDDDDLQRRPRNLQADDEIPPSPVAIRLFEKMRQSRRPIFSNLSYLDVSSCGLDGSAFGDSKLKSVDFRNNKRITSFTAIAAKLNGLLNGSKHNILRKLDLDRDGVVEHLMTTMVVRDINLVAQSLEAQQAQRIQEEFAARRQVRELSRVDLLSRFLQVLFIPGNFDEMVSDRENPNFFKHEINHDDVLSFVITENSAMLDIVKKLGLETHFHLLGGVRLDNLPQKLSSTWTDLSQAVQTNATKWMYKRQADRALSIISKIKKEKDDSCSKKNVTPDTWGCLFQQIVEDEPAEDGRFMWNTNLDDRRREIEVSRSLLFTSLRAAAVEIIPSEVDAASEYTSLKEKLRHELDEEINRFHDRLSSQHPRQQILDLKKMYKRVAARVFETKKRTEDYMMSDDE